MQVACVWQSERHSAFTDLIYFDQRWWCAFREGSTHMSLDGCIRLLVSDDGKSWSSQALIYWPGGDLRDPKFSIRPDGQLLLTAGMRWCTPMQAEEGFYSLGMLFDQSRNGWQEPVIDDWGKSTWRWAVTWQQQQAYSVGYEGRDKAGCLYHSHDGLDWQVLSAPFFPPSRYDTNESSLAFDDQARAYCLTRRDAVGGAKALLGMAEAPYSEWCWKQLNKPLGGQKLLRLSNGEWVAGFRQINERKRKAQTVIQKLDIVKGRFRPWVTLPSGGDCSYVGMVEKAGCLWVSYYSSHLESQARIYIAVIPLRTKKRSQRFR